MACRALVILFCVILFSVTLNIYGQDGGTWSFIGELDYGHLVAILIGIALWKGSWLLGFFKKGKVENKASVSASTSAADVTVHTNGHASLETHLRKMNDKMGIVAADIVLIKTSNDDIVKGRLAYEAAMNQKIEGIQTIVLNELADMKTDEKETSRAVGDLAIKIGELSGEIKGSRR